VDKRALQSQVFFFTWATGSQLRNEGFTLGTFVSLPTPQQHGLDTVIWSTLYWVQLNKSMRTGIIMITKNYSALIDSQVNRQTISAPY